MPRRKNTDGDAATNNSAQPKQPRVRKKKEPSSICSTPTGEHPQLKLEPGQSSLLGMPPGCAAGPMMDMQPPHGMLGPGQPGMPLPHMHPGLPNGTAGPCAGGPGGSHQQPMMDDGSGGAGMMQSYGGGPPQGPPQFDYYQPGLPPGAGGGPPPHFPPPPPMFGGGPAQMMNMLQQQGGGGQGPPHIGPPGPGMAHFPPSSESDQQTPHPHPQMMPIMHPHHPTVQPGHGPMSAGPPPGSAGPPQMPPPPHQFPPPHPMFAGAFPRQPGPFVPLLPTVPQPPFLEYRLQEMNRRLYQFHCAYMNSPENHEQWWDAFTQEFFDESARMTVFIHDFSADNGGFLRREFAVQRSLIPRFYRTMFDNGVNQLHYVMRAPAQELVEAARFQNPELFGTCALSCENLLMVTSHYKPFQTEVHTECRLYIEFGPFHTTLGYRIRHWLIELRQSQEFYSKDGMLPNNPMKSPTTVLGLPLQLVSSLNMWSKMQGLKMIIDRVHETNEPPQIALRGIVIEQEQKQQRAAAAAAAIHIQNPPHSQPGGPPHPMAAMMSGMGPPQLPPSMGPLPPGMGPPQIGGGALMGGGPVPTQSMAAEDQTVKAKPKRQRQRKSAAGGGGAAGTNTSPPKGKKGAGGAAAGAAVLLGGPVGQQTPPAGMAPMGFMGGPPGQQFHPTGMPPTGQYHQDVLTVGEPSMMGCEYGEHDERQISRVENTAFMAGISSHHHQQPGGIGQMMLPPGMGGPGGPGPMSMGQPQQQQPPHPMGESGQLLSDFDLHSQQQQMQPPPTSMWGPPPPNMIDSGGQPQPTMSSGS